MFWLNIFMCIYIVTIREALYIYYYSSFIGDKMFEYDHYTYLRARNFGHRKLILLDFWFMVFCLIFQLWKWGKHFRKSILLTYEICKFFEKRESYLRRHLFWLQGSLIFRFFSTNCYQKSSCLGATLNCL